MLLKIDYALSSSIAAAILAMIPVIGTVLAVFPPLMSALLISPNQALIAGLIIILSSQIVYNVIGPKMLGKAFKIHPVVVILSFVIGYKMVGAWGAIFSIPIVGSIAVITKDLLLFWKKEGKE
jgi:predicted PurR-regulated permease PerM